MNDDIVQEIADFIGEGTALVTSERDWERMRAVIAEYPEVRARLKGLDINQLPIIIKRNQFKEQF